MAEVMVLKKAQRKQAKLKLGISAPAGGVTPARRKNEHEQF